MKDFYDVWLLAGTTSFDGDVLTNALRRTFETRGTPLPEDLSEFLQTIAEEIGKQEQWRAFLERNTITNAHSKFIDIVKDLDMFLRPPFHALLSGEPYGSYWNAGGTWTSSK